jgi:hypothetical protein
VCIRFENIRYIPFWTIYKLPYCVAIQVLCQKFSTQLEDQGCDNELPGQDCHISQGVVIMSMDQVLERWLGGAVTKLQRKAYRIATSSTTNVIWSHLVLNLRLHGEKQVCNRLSCVWPVIILNIYSNILLVSSAGDWKTRLQIDWFEIIRFFNCTHTYVLCSWLKCWCSLLVHCR